MDTINKLAVCCIVLLCCLEVTVSVDVTGFTKSGFRNCIGDSIGFYNDSGIGIQLEPSTCATNCGEQDGCLAFTFDSFAELCTFYSSCDPSENSGSLVAYTVVECGNPPGLANGIPRVSSFYYPHKADYQCISDYTLTGTDTVMCDETGTWSGTEPTCEYDNYYDCDRYCEEVDADEIVSCPGATGEYVMEVTYANYGSVTGKSCGAAGDECLNYESNDQIKAYFNGFSTKKFELATNEISTNQPCAGAILMLEYKCVSPSRTTVDKCYATCTPGNVADSTNTIAVTPTGAQVEYTCNEGYEISEDVTVATVKCIGGATYETLPVCTVISCPDIAEIVNGNADTSDKTFGTIVTFTCDEGYDLDGASPIACLSNKNWSSDFPTCNPVDCGDLSASLQNAMVTYNGEFTFGETGTLTCTEGYELNSIGPSTTITCLDTGDWSNEQDCNIIDCGSVPEADANGATTDVNPLTTFGSKLTYTCSPGFLPPTQAVTCGASKSWNPAAVTCTAVVCPNESTIEGYANVDSVTLSDTTNYQSQATVTCTAGYEIDSIAICNEIAEWDPSIQCDRVSCNNPIQIQYATTSESDNLFGDEVTYTCEQGYEIENESLVTVTCQASKAWTEEPVCTIVECADPDPLIVGIGQVQILSGKTYGSVVTYICQTGYTLVGEGEGNCTADKTWSIEAPQCQEITCPNIEAALGTAGISNASAGTSLSYSCDVGYNLVGNPTILCLNTGLWDNAVPACVAVDCDTPGSIVDGVELSNGGTSYPSTITYQCNQGYTMSGSPSITCLSTATWSDDVPTCTVVDCGTAPVGGENGKEVVGGTTYNSNVTYSCIEGYKLEAEALEINRCTSSGDWLQPTASDCEIIDCGQRESELENGHVVYSGTTYRNTVTYTCEEGYTPVEVVYYCSDEEVWNGTAPVCAAPNCSQIIETIDNGEIVSQSDTSVQYSCDSGYMMNGAANLMCTIDGIWSDPIPTCDLIKKVRVLVYVTTTLDCDDYDAATLKSILRAAQTDLTAVALALVQQISAEFITEAVIITGISCNSPLQLLFEVTVNNTESDVTVTTDLITDALQDLLTSGPVDLVVDGESITLEFEALNPSEDTEIDCEQGYFIDVDSLKCEPCPQNTYQPTDIPQLCLTCPEGFTTDGVATVGDDADVCKPDDNSAGLTIGLSVGIPVGVILLFLFGLMIFLAARKQWYHGKQVKRYGSDWELYDQRQLGYKNPYSPQKQSYGERYPYRW